MAGHIPIQLRKSSAVMSLFSAVKRSSTLLQALQHRNSCWFPVKQRKTLNELRQEKTAYAKTEAHISCTVTAQLRLHYQDSIITLLPKSKISSL